MVNVPKNRFTTMENQKAAIKHIKKKLGNKWIEPPELDLEQFLNTIDKLKKRPDFIDNLFDEDEK